METTYFGLQVINNRFVRRSEIEQLPFFKFWEASSMGSTCLPNGDDVLIYLHDWESFCVLFIKTGKHRFS